jgi:transcriptional regulator GlxA family with amidase domain
MAQLCRLVKMHIGQTPQHYIKELRLTHAYEMIQSTDIPFEQIALQVGYSSFSHFSVAFKQRFGLSPAVLRKSSQRSTLI